MFNGVNKFLRFPIYVIILHFNNRNNLIKFFIIYVPSQQLQGQLQTQHSVDTSNCRNLKEAGPSKTQETGQ
jgi:hypothetical protein